MQGNLQFVAQNFTILRNRLQFIDGIFFDTVHNVVEVKRSDYNVASIEHDYIRLYGFSDVCVQFADIDATVYLS